MKKRLFISVLFVVMTVGFAATAQDVASVSDSGDASVDDGFKKHVFGAHLGLGMAHTVGDNGDAEARLAGGFGLTYDHYLTPMFALTGGFGLIGKGFSADDIPVSIDSRSFDGKEKPLYMEIPIGVKMNFSGLQIGAALAMNIGVGGEVKLEDADDDDYSVTVDYEWDDTPFRQFNIAPKLTVEYAIQIPVVPVALVPGVAWSMHLLNDNDTDSSDDYALRRMNLMFNLGAQFGI